MQRAKLSIKTKNNLEKTIISIGKDLFVGQNRIATFIGPCSVESYAQMQDVAIFAKERPIFGLRGGAFKPRTCPYDFQGLGQEGVEILNIVKKEFQIPIISEVMSISQLPLMEENIDILQIGSRNMQNFDLLKAVGKLQKPVMLKRGLSATIEEFIYAAEYILKEGNPNVMLCERGIRSFDNFTRNVLDIGAVIALKKHTHLPVLVDPSHASGKREFVIDMAKAAIAAGADGLLIECHPDPDNSVTDAGQTISFAQMDNLIKEVEPIAKAVGRTLY